MKKSRFLLFGLVQFVIVITFISCERDADIEIPGGVQKPVVYGWIEPNQPPIVILTRAQPYFGTSNFSSFDALFIHGATINITVDGYVAPLTEICSSTIPDSLLPIISQIIGVDSLTLTTVNYCVYTTFDPNVLGVTGKTYYFDAATPDNEILTAETVIPFAVPLDSLWFIESDGLDSLGFVWARMSDPDTVGNCYRWFAMRLGEDNSFIPPMGSTFEDKFINNTTFDFGFNRGYDNFSNAPEVEGERGYFKIGDTVIVKFTSIDKAHYLFWRSFETQAVSNGNPFSAPAPVRGNVQGALGVWGGYGPFIDTLIIQ